MKKIFGVAIVAIIALCGLSANAAVAGEVPQQNASCSKPKNNVNYQGIHFTCALVNGKYVWKKVGLASSPKNLSKPDAPSTPAGPDLVPIYANGDAAPLAPLSKCQLIQTTGPGKGTNSVPAVGEVNVALIPIDFSNAPASGDVQKLFSDDARQLEEWSKYISLGKMNYKVDLAATSWIRSPKPADWYNCPECGTGGKRMQSKEQSLSQLIDAADKIYDFSNIQVIIFIFPPAVTSKFGTKVYGVNQEIQTKEGQIRVSVFGDSPLEIPNPAIQWDLIAHEILHFQGFIGHGPENGSSFGIMMNQWGLSKTILSWEGFRAGWYSDQEIACISKDSIKSGITMSLNSLDKLGNGLEGLIVALSDEEEIVIEYRTSGRYSYLPATLTAYHLNINKPGYRCDSCNQVVAESKSWWGYLRDSKKLAGNWTANQTRSFSGVKITHLGSGRIRVTI
jgi:hypothetical protein